MLININGKEVELTNLNLAHYMKVNFKQRKGLAVCVNLEIIPASKWQKIKLNNKDKVDIIEAAPGG